MAIEILELVTDDQDQSSLRSRGVSFRRADHSLTAGMAKLSHETPCSQMVFVELPEGFSSTFRIPDRDQTAVVLSGSLRISASDGGTAVLHPGATFKVPKADRSEHKLEVIGETSVNLMVIMA